MSDVSMPDSLDEWQEMFSKIYSDRNRRLNRRAQSILLRVVEEGSEVAEAFREDNIRLAEFGLTLETMKKKREIADKLRVLEWELPDVFAWLCTFCDYVGHKLSDDVWYKYPKVCPYCLQPMNCICVIMRREDRPSKEERERRLNHLRKSSAPLKTLDEWVCKLSELYAHINRKLPREATGFHTVEEIGELSQELRRYEENDPTFTQQDFQEEIADVFTWTVGMAIRAGLDLRQILWQKFPGVCPYCGASPCGCPLPG